MVSEMTAFWVKGSHCDNRSFSVYEWESFCLLFDVINMLKPKTELFIGPFINVT